MEFPRDDCIAMAELIVADAMAEWKVPGLAVAIRPPLRPFSRLARRLAQCAPGRPTGQAPPRADSLFASSTSSQLDISLLSRRTLSLGGDFFCESPGASRSLLGITMS
jgi:hypothetical protein